jgi:hypothetical protein
MLIMTIQKLLTPEEFVRFFETVNDCGLDAEGYALSLWNGRVARYLKNSKALGYKFDWESHKAAGCFDRHVS